MELLREAAPGFSRVGAMVIPEEATVDGTVIGLQLAAGALGLDVHIVGVRSAAELEGHLRSGARSHASALCVGKPSVPYPPDGVCCKGGGHASAGNLSIPRIRANGRSDNLRCQFARHVQHGRRLLDKILKGARPGDLPLQAAEKYELVVNLTTAKALGLTISEAFLLRADEVIE